ncbi:hypothetical protein [Streptomyces flavofungini]|uniref:phage terminase small subunit n=1 Tax=Streptomyces flavofungini TaxID=68200 RepID=UPI0025B14519|nr:hypothetical protein [Streptomyces flavofungini]WJV49923.1 hypothetical protein QUY26_33000 [Streptomyces flavofungini]
MAWTETDWAELELTAKLVDAFFQGDHKVAGEIRQRTAKWGATVEDRSRLRMSIVEPDEIPGNEAPASGPSEFDEPGPEEGGSLVSEAESFLKAFGNG